MKTLILLIFWASLALAQAVSPEVAKAEFKNFIKAIHIEPINQLMLQQNGRLKPLDTLARETMLFLSGSYTPFGENAVSTYLGIIAYDNSKFLELLEIRDLKVRSELGFLKSKRFFSLSEIEASSLAQIAEPLFKKQQDNARSLDEYEKKVIETYNQYSVLRDLAAGQSFLYHADFGFLTSEKGTKTEINNEIQLKAKAYFSSFSSGASEQKVKAQELIDFTKNQPVPELFDHYREKAAVEIFYNHSRIFLIAALFSIFLGFAFLMPLYTKKVSSKISTALYLIPLILITVGLGIRVYITEFAPVTNMYGTMIWVAFGTLLFSFFILLFYGNFFVPAVTLITAGLILLLTEKIPLILNPDLDPIVAVLRSNFWLSTHVTCITISYAAYTIAMVLGNITLVRFWIVKDNSAFIKEYSHYAYRMIQLGCFLLTVGIILGGVWADYSWGRFWGWDPKETWALIADLGFLAILHGRFVGWITPASLLIWSPLAYLLVIMAWYGVNFILAAGLHSYGFSSGGAAMVGIFVTMQLILLAAGLFKARHQLFNKMV